MLDAPPIANVLSVHRSFEALLQLWVRFPSEDESVTLL